METNAKELVDRFAEGKTVRETMGISLAELDAVYAVAYNRYRAGKYDEAAKLFASLCEMDHTNRKFWMGLAAARQCLRDYTGACRAYTLCVQLQCDEPSAWYHLAECHAKLGSVKDALDDLEALDDLTTDSLYKEKARTLREKLGKAEQ